VLKDPEPTIKVSELADSSVNFICRPWVKTPDYWTVYWEVTRAVKERFDEEGNMFLIEKYKNGELIKINGRKIKLPIDDDE